MIRICLSANLLKRGLTSNAEYRRSTVRPTWKCLEVDNYQKISDDIYDYVINYTEILKFKTSVFYNNVSPIHIVQHVPSLKKFLDDNFLPTPTVTAIIVVPPVKERNLHVDTFDPYVRILWPIKNCQGSLTRQFDVPRECLKLNFYPLGSTDTDYQIMIERDWPLLSEIELLQPVLIDVSVAHEVHPAPDATEPRITFTIGFDRDLPISKSVKAWFGFQR